MKTIPRKLIARTGVIVSTLFLLAAAAPAAESPAGRDWNVQTLLNGYEMSGYADPKWDAAAKAALTEYGLALTRESRKEANQSWQAAFNKEASQAIQSGCKDPLLAYFARRTLVNVFNESGDVAKAHVGEIARMIPDIQQTRHHSIRKYYACLRAAALVGVRARIHKSEITGVATMNAELIAELRHFQLQAITNLVDALNDRSLPISEVNMAAAEALALCQKQVPEAQSAFTNLAVGALMRHWTNASGCWLVQGQLNIDAAWAARGGGYAGSVTEEGWKTFGERLLEARRCLERGWALNPKDPKIPTKMITVELGIGEDRAQMELWFKRAMAADSNCYEACSAKLYYLEPKWHGSEEDMLEFGRQCAASTQWGGTVPLILCDAHTKAAAYLGASERPNYWKRPEVWPDVKRAYEKYFKLNPDDVKRRYLYANFAYKCEQWEDLNKLLPTLPTTGLINYDQLGGKAGFDRMVEEARKHGGEASPPPKQ